MAEDVGGMEGVEMGVVGGIFHFDGVQLKKIV